MYVTDYEYKHVLAINLDRASVDTIGRPGHGPGEFRLPWSVTADASRVLVYDISNNRVQMFSPDGSFVQSRAVATSHAAGGASLNNEGRLLVATGGERSVLAAIYGGDGQYERGLGTPILEMAEDVNFSELRRQIAARMIPRAYANSLLPVWSRDGSAFLVFQAKAEVRRYDPNGVLVWTREIKDAALDQTIEIFFEKNAKERNPGRVHPLVLFNDAKDVNGDLWILLNTGSILEDEGRDGLIIVLDGADGRIVHKLVIPGLNEVGPFAVSPSGDRVFLYSRSNAELLEFRIPS